MRRIGNILPSKPSTVVGARGMDVTLVSGEGNAGNSSEPLFCASASLGLSKDSRQLGGGMKSASASWQAGWAISQSALLSPANRTCGYDGGGKVIICPDAPQEACLLT